jgi:FAD/FMN-containing dehydrogenase
MKKMSIAKAAYSALHDIVGSRYISNDPAMLDSYRYSLSQTSTHQGPFFGVYTPRGAAVLLPGSVEEVQAIVKICNTYTIKFKASSTF